MARYVYVYNGHCTIREYTLDREALSMSTECTPKTIVAYTRVSDPRQVEEGQSLDDQRRRVQEYCRDRMDGIPHEIEFYPEEGRSGTWTIRQVPIPGVPVRDTLSDVVDRCTSEDVHALVVDDVDRFGRNQLVWHAVQKQFLKPNGVHFWIIAGNLDMDDSDDEMLASFLAALSEAESTKKRQRSLRMNRERRTAGCPPSGQLSYGWRWETDEEFSASAQPFKSMVRVDDEARWVRWIFDQYLRRGRVMLDICAELNERGVSRGDSDIPWQARHIRAIFDKPRHAGLTKDNDDELKPGAHFDQRIVDPDVWYAVQDLRSKRSTRGPRALSQRDAPLLGVARCGMCGQHVQLQRDQRGQPLYACPKPQEGEPRTCDGFSKRADAVETVVADFIRHIADAPRLREMIRNEAAEQIGEGREQLELRRDELNKQIESLDDRLEEWAVKLTDGVVGEEAFARISNRWQREREEAQEQLAEVETRLRHGAAEEARVEQVMRALDSFSDTWEQLEAPSIRQLLLSMVEKLTLTPEDDSALTVHFKAFYVPEMTQHIPHLREGVGADDTRLADLTLTDLAFLALHDEGLSASEIAARRGVKPTAIYSTPYRIRKRTDLDDLDEIARLARPLVDEYRQFLPTDRPSARATSRAGLEPTERQLEVASLLARGLSYTDIAERLNTEVSTIRSHMTKLRKRLDVDSNDEAFVRLAQQGSLELEQE